MNGLMIEVLLEVLTVVVFGVSVGSFILGLVEDYEIRTMNKRIEAIREKLILRGVSVPVTLTPIKPAKLPLVASFLFGVISFTSIRSFGEYPVLKYLDIDMEKVFDAVMGMATDMITKMTI